MEYLDHRNRVWFLLRPNPFSRIRKLFSSTFEYGFRAGILSKDLLADPYTFRRRVFDCTAYFLDKVPEVFTLIESGTRDASVKAQVLYPDAVRIELVERVTINTIYAATTNSLPAYFEANSQPERKPYQKAQDEETIPLICTFDGHTLLKVDNEGFVYMNEVVVGRDVRLPACFPKPQ